MGPEIVGVSGLSALPIVVMIGVGVIVGITGHLAGSRRLAATGIAILFIATALLVIGAYVAYQDDPGDPRPKCDDPVGC